MTTLGRAYIEIVADGSNFGRSLREEVEKELNTNLPKSVKTAGAQAGKDLDAEMAKGVKAGAAEVENEAEAAGKRGGKKFTSGLKKEVEAGAKDVARGVGHIGDDIGDELAGSVGRRFRRNSPGLFASIGASFRALTPKIRAWGDEAGGNFVKSLEKQLKSLESKVSKIAGPPLKALGGAVMSVAKAGELAGLSFAFWGTAIASLLPQILSLGGAVVQLSGLLLGIPSALGPLAIGLLTAKFAFSGFSAALKATDDKQFAKATEHMGASAKTLARELRSLRPMFDSIRQGAQEAFSQSVIGAVRQFSTELGPQLRAGFRESGDALGFLTAQMLQFFESAKGIRLLREWFDSAAVGMGGLGDNIGRLLGGISDLNNAIKPAMDRIIDRANGAAGAFGGWLSKISATGQAARWFNGALRVLGQLVDVVKSLASILKQAFDASGQSAFAFLGTLGLILRAFDEFLKTAEGQTALHEFFAAISDITKALIPVFKALGTALAGILPIFAEAVVALTPGLGALVTAIGKALANLGPAIIPLAKALSDMVVVIAPQLPALADAFTQLVLAILPLVPALTPLIIALSQTLVNAINGLAGPVASLVNAFAPLIKSFGEHQGLVEGLAGAYLGLKLTLLGLSGIASTIKFVNMTTQLAGMVTSFKDLQVAGDLLAESFPKWGAATKAFGLIADGVAASVRGITSAMKVLVLEWIPALVVSLGEATASMIGLDIAMDANPIGVVALGIAALIAILIALGVAIWQLVKH